VKHDFRRVKTGGSWVEDKKDTSRSLGGKRDMSETRINEAELEELKHKLFCLRAGLQDPEGSSKEATEPVEPDQAASCRLSPGAAMQAQLMAEEPARRRQRQLGKVEGALRRIEAGDYGNCFLCGEEIDGHRLSSDPTNTRCIKCV
jgi:DnaK suppressor protein